MAAPPRAKSRPSAALTYCGVQSLFPALARQGAVVGGRRKGEEPCLPPRDTRAWSTEDRRRMD
ncbi:hypothetical protein AB0D59_12315 [Streptomyces sp. NPDC048417]|uniref:hypothetical protein n=1 Tax=Streptomyces sp. NPDC048417 TaxID=3155387 RepID=UPI0034370C37